MADWEQDHDAAAAAAVAATSIASPTVVAPNSWDDEDIEDVQDSWDQEPSESLPDDANKETVAQAAARKKKSLKDKIREKEEREAREAMPPKQLTDEEKQIEKRRALLASQAADYESALDTFGDANRKSLDSYQPVTKDEFDDFRKRLVEKIRFFKDSPYYADFIDNLVRDLVLDCSADKLKNLSVHLNTLSTAKRKLEPAAAKAKPKAKNKPKLHHGKSGGGLDDDDYDALDDQENAKFGGGDLDDII